MPKTAWEFIAPLSITAKTWKQPWWSLIGKMINKLLYVDALEYYSVIKSELSSNEKIYMKHNCIFLSEKSHSENNTHCIIPVTWHLAAAKSLQSCPTLLQPHRRQPTRLPRPWDSAGKNTGVGCHFLLQCMRVKSESEVAQLCPNLRNPMDCSLPGSSVHEIIQARVLEWVAIASSIHDI